MKVMKFGGATIGQPQRMQHVAQLASKEEQPKIVVLSALSGTTSILAEISQRLHRNERSDAKRKIEKLKTYYTGFAQSLLKDEAGKFALLSEIEEHFHLFTILLKISFSDALTNDILAQGEQMSCKLFSAFLSESGIPHQLLPALDFMQLDAYGEPLVGNIKVKLTQLLNKNKDQNLFITQGNLCRNSRGEVDNLGRGGSDYTAALISAAINSETCEIWTDIEAIQNNDSKVVKNTLPVAQLNFEEAAELAYFGSKILHPHSLWPARRFNIPVKLCNVTKPSAPYTLILNEAQCNGVKAIAARDGITVIKIKSNRMLLAYGFSKKVFEIFEKYETPIDMIATSEVAISLTIDNNNRLEQILTNLEQFGTTEVDANQCLVAIVGKDILHNVEIMNKLLSSIATMPVRMLSYGGSSDNISLIVSSDNKKEMLQKLHNGLFNAE